MLPTKKNLSLIFLAIGILLIPFSASVRAQGPYTGDPQRNTSLILFSSISAFQDTLLQSPYSATSLVTGIPANWTLATDSKIILNMTAGITSQQTLGGTLNVYLNGTVIATLPVNWTGDKSVEIPVSAASLASRRGDGLYELRIELSTAFDCTNYDQSWVTIHADSHFKFSYDAGNMPLDLRILPRPFFQRTVEQDSAVLVIPEKPSSDELQAAFSVMAGFGKMTDGNLPISIVPVNQLSDAEEKGQHLIFVGTPAAFPPLSQVSWPTAIDGKTFKSTDLQAQDGILQLAVSPWNPNKVLLLVSGNTTGGVVNAAAALSSGTVLTGRRSDVSIVSGERVLKYLQAPATTQSSDVIESTFAREGFPTTVINRIGQRTFYFHFDIPAGKQLGPDSYLTLSTGHSTLISYNSSGMTVRLNGDPVGSVRFSDSDNGTFSTKIVLPVSSAHTGSNELAVSTDIQSMCINPNSENTWLTIRDDSAWHLSFIKSDSTAINSTRLSEYQTPYASEPSLSHTMFVVPSADVTAWQVAAQIAYNLGQRARGDMMNIPVTFDKSPAPEVLNSYHLIVVGLSTELPFIQDLNAKLSQVFKTNYDILAQQSSPVIYRMDKDTNLGTIEIFPSPWNNSLTTVTVLSESSTGLVNAGRALTTADTRRKMVGNLAIVNDQQTLVQFVKFPSTTIEKVVSEQPVSIVQNISVPDNTRTIIIVASVLGLAVVILITASLTWLIARRRA